MKIIFLTVGVALLFTLSANAQFFNSSHIPEGAKIAFHHQYPKAKHASWSRDKSGYQVRFESRHKTYFVMYDELGNSQAEVIEIRKVKLPHRAKRQLRDNYTSFAVKGVLRIRSSGGKTVYGTHIDRAEESYDLVFNDSGYIVSVVPAEISEENISTEE